MNAVKDKRFLSFLNSRLTGGLNNDRLVTVKDLIDILNDYIGGSIDLSDYLKKDGSVSMTGLLELSGDPINPLNPVTLQFLNQIITDLINGAPSGLDTLGEIATELQALSNDLTYLQNAELKITYWESISLNSGQITKPTNSSIILDGFAEGVDALVETIVNGKPSGNSPVTAGGSYVTVSSFDTAGNYILSGTPTTTPVALLYIITIKASDYQNLVESNIIPNEVYVKLPTATATNDVLVGDTGGGRWVKKTLSEFSLILGIRKDTEKYGNTSGTNSYTLTLNPVLGSYVAGESIKANFGNINTGASTINIDSLGAVNIVTSDGAALTGGELQGIMELVYNGTNYQIVGGSGGYNAANELFNYYNFM